MLNKFFTYLLGMFFLLCNVAHSQTPMYYVNYTGGQNYIPFNFSSNKVQWLYYPTDLTGTNPLSAGFITTIYIKAASAVTNVSLPNLTIKLGTTTLTGMTNGPWVGGLTTVLSAPTYSQSSVLGQWVPYTLTNPYYYDGVSNLVLEVSVSNYQSGGYLVYQDFPGGNRRLYGETINANSTGTDGTQAAFGFDIQSNCFGMPSAGSIVKADNDVDCGATTMLSLTGNTSSNGITYQWQNSIDKITWNNVSTASSYTTGILLQKTYYRCIITCTNSNLIDTTRIDSVLVNRTPLNLGVDTHICNNTTINLMANVNNVSTYLWDDLSSQASRVVNSPGAYYITVTQTNGCVTSDTIQIRDGVEPVNYLAASYDLCADSVITINAGNPFMNFLWNNNEDSMAIFARQPGNYEVTVTSNDQCSAQFSTTVVQRPLPIFTIPDEVLICIGEPLVIDGTAQYGNTYRWNGVAGSPILNVVDSGVYRLSVRSSYGCLAEDETHVTYRPNPTIQGFTYIPEFYELMKTVSFALIDPQNVNSVEWDFGDGHTSTLYNPIHRYDDMGAYVVQVKLFNSCNQTIYDQTINIDITGVDDVSSNTQAIKVYPNPAKDNIHIDNSSNSTITALSLYDATGRLMQYETKQTTSMSVQTLANGQYQLRIELANGQAVMKKIVIERN